MTLPCGSAKPCTFVQQYPLDNAPIPKRCPIECFMQQVWDVIAEISVLAIDGSDLSKIS